MLASYGGLTLAALLHTVALAEAQSWCGKNYLPNETVVPPGGQFPIPSTTDTPLLAFRCSPAIMPYLAEDTNGTIVIETQVTYEQMAFTSSISSSAASDNSTSLSVSVSVGGQDVGTASVPLNKTAFEIPFSLSILTPGTDALDIQCSASTSDGQTFTANSTMLLLPDRTDGGSVTKMDLRTGAMLVKNDTTSEWETIFPIGFYTSDDYLNANLTAIPLLKSQGFTVVHPVPPFDNTTQLTEVLDLMEEAGLYLMYDMRFTYTNLTSVAEQVNEIKTRKNLLLWYTGDEPDGNEDAINASTSSYSLIKSLDGGGYHPVSLVLNCEDYYFEGYSQGADVVMQDVYPIAVNTSFSLKYDTVCTKDFGCCGCDNCKGHYADIRDRMDVFAYRLEVMGQKKTKTVWGVPQAFGDSDFWTRYPTGNEWLIEAVLSINHGATGIVPWIDPTPDDIKASASLLAQSMPTIKNFLYDPAASFSRPSSDSDNIDAAVWSSSTGATLVMATNLVNSSSTLSFDLSGLSGGANEIFSSGGSLDVDGGNGTVIVSLDALGSVAYILESSSNPETESSSSAPGPTGMDAFWPVTWIVIGATVVRSLS